MSSRRSNCSGGLHFWRLAIKPGRPVALGQIGGVPLIGLPGNPVAALVTFVVLARPLILKARRGSGVRAAAFPCPILISPTARSRGGANMSRASLQREGGDLVAVKYARDGAGILSSITPVGGARDRRRGNERARAGVRPGRFPALCRGDRVKLPLFRLVARAHRLRRGGHRSVARSGRRSRAARLAAVARRPICRGIARSFRRPGGGQSKLCRPRAPRAWKTTRSRFSRRSPEARVMIRVQREDFDVGVELERLAAGNHRIGGVASFVGLVRDLGGGDRDPP